MSEHDFPDILQHFELAGHFDSAAVYGSGHINDTWLIRFAHSDRRKRYVLQRINGYVFSNPVHVAENIDRVCRHFGESDASAHLPGQKDFVPIRTRGGDAYWRAPGGDVWRLWPFVYGARTVNAVESPAQAREAAAAFGWFQRLIDDLPGPPLHETIPGFHDTMSRLEQFRRALDQDAQDRAGSCGPEIEYALATEAHITDFSKLIAAGDLPMRIAHNDAKINNVMLDEQTDKAVCVIDLDTVMPGLAHFDFGDMLRTMTVSAAEDTVDLESVAVDMGLYAAITEGYLGATGDMLSATEIEHLPDAGRIITLETGLRFLTDYLEGDRYFRTSRPAQNLDRCRTQFALARSIDRQMDDMRALTDRTARAST